MSDITLEQLVNHFQLANRAEGKSPKTLSWYQQNLDLFHRPLAEQEESLVVPLADHTVAELASFVAQEFGLKTADVTLASGREIVRKRSCSGCVLVDEVRRLLVLVSREDAEECASCGGRSFDLETHTVLDEPGLRLSEAGLTPGKVVYAHLHGRRVILLPLEDGA